MKTIGTCIEFMGLKSQFDRDDAASNDFRDASAIFRLEARSSLNAAEAGGKVNDNVVDHSATYNELVRVPDKLGLDSPGRAYWRQLCRLHLRTKGLELRFY